MTGGDGLRRPVNAPAGQATPPGLQAGVTNGVEFARQVIVFGPTGTPVGVFVYAAGTVPGPGNKPVVSITLSATDPYGNTVVPGVAIYGTDGSIAELGTSGTAAALLLTSPGATHITTLAAVFAGGVGAGLPNEAENLTLTSGKAGGHADAALQLFSAAADNSSAARAVIEFGGATALQVGPLNTTFTTGSGSGVSGTPAITQTDTTVDTNANNGTQPMTMTWAIPANDPQVGTVYEIETSFSGVFETTTLGFKPRLSANPTMVTSGGDVIANTFFGAGAGFAGSVRLRMVVTATGAGGTADFFIAGEVGNNGNRSPGVNESVLSSQARTVAIDTTVANSLVIVSVWGGAAAGQTVSAYGSVFTRKGP